MVSIITINFNLAGETISCVQSVLASDYMDYMTFLIDNDSHPEYYKNFKVVFDNHSKVQLLRNKKNCGYVGGVNYGLRTAQKIDSDYFMVMNNVLL
jgi:GT2 family glycosyltransferase